MGGICAVKGNNAENIVKEMCKRLKHRGPDDEGAYAPSKNIALGHRALFIHESQRAHQPLSNEDETVWITFDGAIYNFETLAKKLDKSHKFRSISSAELVIHAYEEAGLNCLEEFNGDFAFCLWDSKKKLLFLARDKLGVRPLYYCHLDDSNRFLVSSEIKAFFVDPLVPRKPNDEVIHEYLLKGIRGHKGDTFFEGIKELLPAHYVLVNQNNVVVQEYWSPINSSRSTAVKDEKTSDYSSRFLELFRESIRIRLPEDMLIGTFLSGGLDSSSVACLTDRVLKSDFSGDTRAHQVLLSAVYPNNLADEKAYADEVARSVNGRIDYLYPSIKGQWDDIKSFVYHMDEPVPVFNYYVYWCVSRAARSKVRVTFSGQGPDEALGGHGEERMIYYKELWKRRRLLPLLKELLATLPQHKIFKTFNDVDFSALLNLSEKRESTVERFFAPEFAAANNPNETLYTVESLNDFLLNEVTRTLLLDHLQFGDRAASAFSVEMRYPFLDYRLVEYMFSLPASQRINNGWTKYVLRSAMKGIIPEAIRKRRGKLGTPVPMEWLVYLEKEIREIFESKEFCGRGYFNQQAVLRMYDRFCNGSVKRFDRMFYNDLIWRILNLELWFEVFFDQQN
ncbi:asparagine synthase (glutamine-hydrolyzing) [Candidatus Bathyarchaeota archaeon]|nr:asparagine synthase (glutamine-hydrolyzing) [Candidatus Bathyarchaeota archaeon]